MAGGEGSNRRVVSRPTFLEKDQLVQSGYACQLCEDILVQPHITTCGARMCKICMKNLFGSNSVIRCPFSHTHFTPAALNNEVCQVEGLHYDRIMPDIEGRRDLEKEKCFCGNFSSGCEQTPSWKDLKKNEDDCQEGEADCDKCNELFTNPSQLKIQKKMNPVCTESAGKCCYYEHCRAELSTPNKMQQHLQHKKSEHLEASTIKLCELGQGDEKHKAGVIKSLKDRIRPIEKLAAELCQKVHQLELRMEGSGVQNRQVLQSLKAIDDCQTSLDEVGSTLRLIECQWTQLGVENADVVKQIGHKIGMETPRLQTGLARAAPTSYDGTLLMKIENYWCVKAKHQRDEGAFFSSPYFYSSRYGYKMSMEILLNGYGEGRNKYVSVCFTLRRGPYDELLRFPFKQRIAITLLSVCNHSRCVTKYMDPDDSVSFQKQTDDDNVPVGHHEFILQSELETDLYLKDDTIYFQCQVEPGGDVIP